MSGAALLGLVGAVLAVSLVAAHCERAAAQRARQATERSERPQRDLKNIPLPGRPTDAPKPAPKDTADKKGAEEKSKDGKDADEGLPVPDEWPPEEIVRALRDCVRLLAPIAAEIEIAEPIKSGACGAPAPVRLRKIGVENPVTLSPPATINCPMVVALHRWVQTQLQPEARRLLGSPVVSLSNVSAYSCRLRNGSKSSKLSEHALANALDIGAFETADGQTVTVARGWGPTERDIKRSAAGARETKDSNAKSSEVKAGVPPTPKAAPRQKTARKSRASRFGAIPLPERRPDPKAPAPSGEQGEQEVSEAKPIGGKPVQPLKPATSKEARFLKKIHEQACGIFGTVLGPEANDAHRDHFHFDLARRRSRAYCE